MLKYDGEIYNWKETREVKKWKSNGIKMISRLKSKLISAYYQLELLKKL